MRISEFLTTFFHSNQQDRPQVSASQLKADFDEVTRKHNGLVRALDNGELEYFYGNVWLVHREFPSRGNEVRVKLDSIHELVYGNGNTPIIGDIMLSYNNGYMARIEYFTELDGKNDEAVGFVFNYGKSEIIADILSAGSIKGDPGPVGPIGPQGIPGPKGETGDKITNITWVPATNSMRLTYEGGGIKELALPVSSDLVDGLAPKGLSKQVAEIADKINGISSGGIKIMGEISVAFAEFNAMDDEAKTAQVTADLEITEFGINNSIKTSDGVTYIITSIDGGVPKWVKWSDSPISKWTNDSEGLIKGSNVSGKIYAEANGTGSVVGWDGLNVLVDEAYVNSDEAMERATSAINAANGALDSAKTYCDGKIEDAIGEINGKLGSIAGILAAITGVEA